MHFGGIVNMPDMLVKLYDLPEMVPLVKKINDQGVVVRRVMAYEKLDLVEWVVKIFGRGWASECDLAFTNHPISCFIAVKAGNILGFACYDSTCKNFFGPTGIIKESRGLGIGKALLVSCLGAMAANGYAYAIIGAPGPQEYYVKTLGATIIEGSSPGIYPDPLIRDRAGNKDIGE
jgi:hypothetical protein